MIPALPVQQTDDWEHKATLHQDLAHLPQSLDFQPHPDDQRFIYQNPLQGVPENMKFIFAMR